ncbi:hypothetical protein NIES4074_58390 [Cylindrospermum sp. NIES-4074]|nr:hypothetical protein NIES4074_58390 [Cylindrospermum sp. NIES-4074]
MTDNPGLSQHRVCLSSCHYGIPRDNLYGMVVKTEIKNLGDGASQLKARPNQTLMRRVSALASA